MQELSLTPVHDGQSCTALLEMTIEREAEQVSEVRHGVADVLEAIGQEVVVADAALVVSELVANAVAHADAKVGISVCRAGSALHIEVRDDGAGHPEMMQVGPDIAEGRGLFIVDQLATRWGVEEADPVGKTVWCELALT